MSYSYETASADIYTILRDFSKDNRRQQTPYEYALWQELRKLKCGVRFRRQHPIGDYIADFVCLPIRLVIEVDGGVNTSNAAKLYEAGADVLVAGNAVFKSDNPQQTIRELKGRDL